MKHFNRFGNMMPSKEYIKRSYLMSEKPFRIAGNLYYVGNVWCSSHLIDTGKGLILLDTPCLPELAYLINSIWILGYNPQDIKYIVVSHAHVDHYGAVKALVHLTGAKTFMSEIDVKDMKDNPEFFEEMNTNMGQYNECFEADVKLKDGDIIELGNTKMRCVLTPGHTVGTMSHFWRLEENGKTYNVGIYGGAGFSALTDENLEKNGLPLSMKDVFLQSIDKVWKEKVDIMLGNHPFHNDIFIKNKKMQQGNKDAFIDSEEWNRFLTELKSNFIEFLQLNSEEIHERFAESQLMEYCKSFR